MSSRCSDLFTHPAADSDTVSHVNPTVANTDTRHTHLATATHTEPIPASIVCTFHPPFTNAHRSPHIASTSHLAPLHQHRHLHSLALLIRSPHPRSVSAPFHSQPSTMLSRLFLFFALQLAVVLLLSSRSHAAYYVFLRRLHAVRRSRLRRERQPVRLRGGGSRPHCVQRGARPASSLSFAPPSTRRTARTTITATVRCRAPYSTPHPSSSAA